MSTWEEKQMLRDLVPVTVAVVGMTLAMWVLHLVVELWW